MKRVLRLPRDASVPKACAALGVLAGGLAVAPGLSAALIATASPASSPTCATATSVCLAVYTRWFGGRRQFRILLDLRFTNLSGHTCALAGYPGVSAVSLSGRQLGEAASFAGAAGLTGVDLVNGATATSALRITDVANFPGVRAGRRKLLGCASTYPTKRHRRSCRSHSLRAKRQVRRSFRSPLCKSESVMPVVHVLHQAPL